LYDFTFFQLYYGTYSIGINVFEITTKMRTYIIVDLKKFAKQFTNSQIPESVPSISRFRSKKNTSKIYKYGNYRK
jgi:hypothetical protein